MKTENKENEKTINEANEVASQPPKKSFGRKV